jgi:hypothetical protein
MHAPRKITRMMDYPGTGRNTTAVSGRRLMPGRAIRIPDTAFARRRIMARRNFKMGIAMLMKVRSTVVIFPMVIVPASLVSSIFLEGIPVYFPSLS